MVSDRILLHNFFPIKQFNVFCEKFIVLGVLIV